MTVLSLLSALSNFPYARIAPGLDKLYPRSVGFDLHVYQGRFAVRHSVRFFTQPGYPWNYPAPAIFFYSPFYRSPHGTILYCLVVAGLTLSFAAAFALALRRSGLALRNAVAVTVGTLLLAWPLYFAAQRGNVEALTWTLTAISVWLYMKRRYGVGAAVLGVVGSVKLYPLFFLGLWLKQRRYAAIAGCLLTAALTTLLALRFMEPDVLDAFHRVSEGVHSFTAEVSAAVVLPNAGYDHSLFGMVKSITRHMPHNLPRELTIYYVVAGASALLLYLLRVMRLPDVYQVVFLACATVLLPPTSFDYTLVVLYIPFAWLAVLAVRERRLDLTWPMVLLAVGLSPQTFLWFDRLPEIGEDVKALCLFGLMAWACIAPQQALVREDAALHTGWLDSEAR